MGLDPELRRQKIRMRTPDKSAAWISRMRTHFTEHGFGFWAVELPERARFIGHVGLLTLTPDLPGFPGVEIGWELAQAYWGQGFATETALASVRYGFDQLQLNEIVATTAACNIASRRVMEKIGMRHVPAEDFQHPDLAPGHFLSHRVFYRVEAAQQLP